MKGEGICLLGTGISAYVCALELARHIGDDFAFGETNDLSLDRRFFIPAGVRHLTGTSSMRGGPCLIRACERLQTVGVRPHRLVPTYLAVGELRAYAAPSWAERYGRRAVIWATDGRLADIYEKFDASLWSSGKLSMSASSDVLSVDGRQCAVFGDGHIAIDEAMWVAHVKDQCELYLSDTQLPGPDWYSALPTWSRVNVHLGVRLESVSEGAHSGVRALAVKDGQAFETEFDWVAVAPQPVAPQPPPSPSPIYSTGIMNEIDYGDHSGLAADAIRVVRRCLRDAGISFTEGG